MLLDLGIGNIRSVENWLGRLPREFTTAKMGSEVTTDSSTTLVIPGVGDSVEYARRICQWGCAVEALKHRRFRRLVGICAGFQVLCSDVSERGREAKGVGIIPATSGDQVLSTPHNGWSTVDISFLKQTDVSEVQRKEVFFNHACCVIPSGDFSKFSINDLGIATQYIGRNIFGLQYHPEKSGPLGEAIGNFLFDV